MAPPVPRSGTAGSGTFLRTADGNDNPERMADREPAVIGRPLPGMPLQAVEGA